MLDIILTNSVAFEKVDKCQSICSVIGFQSPGFGKLFIIYFLSKGAFFFFSAFFFQSQEYFLKVELFYPLFITSN